MMHGHMASTRSVKFGAVHQHVSQATCRHNSLVGEGPAVMGGAVQCPCMR